MKTQRVRLSAVQTKTITLSDDSEITIKAGIDYDSFDSLLKLLEQSDDNKAEEMRLSVNFLKKIVINWNFVDADDKPIEYKKELLDQLDISSIVEIIQPVVKLYQAEKKRLELLGQTSSMEEKGKE